VRAREGCPGCSNLRAGLALSFDIAPLRRRFIENEIGGLDEPGSFKLAQKVAGADDADARIDDDSAATVPMVSNPVCSSGEPIGNLFDDYVRHGFPMGRVGAGLVASLARPGGALLWLRY
jgi:hypothetical protein